MKVDQISKWTWYKWRRKKSKQNCLIRNIFRCFFIFIIRKIIDWFSKINIPALCFRYSVFVLLSFQNTCLDVLKMWIKIPYCYVDLLINTEIKEWLIHIHLWKAVNLSWKDTRTKSTNMNNLTPSQRPKFKHTSNNIVTSTSTSTRMRPPSIHWLFCHCLDVHAKKTKKN